MTIKSKNIVRRSPRSAPRISLLATMMLALVLFVGLAAAATSPAPNRSDKVAPYEVSEGHGQYLPLLIKSIRYGVRYGALDHDSLEREYYLYVPRSYTGQQPVPLIFNYHAYSRDALTQMVYGDFRPVADATGAIVVHPQGAIWNGNRLWSVGSFYTNPLVDDVGFTDTLIDAIAQVYNIDQDRIYSAGFSNGGYMSYLLACQLSQRFAAVANVAGSMTSSMLDECQPARPVPVIHIHGLDDVAVPYGGDSQSTPVDEIMAYWVAANQASPTPAVRPLPDIDPTDGSTISEFVYSGGQDGADVILLQVRGGGHTWPGSAISGSGTNHDIDASAEIWSFFANYDINGRRTNSD